MENKNRLELAFESHRKEIIRLVSPPYTGTPEEFEAIKPSIDKAKPRVKFHTGLCFYAAFGSVFGTLASIFSINIPYPSVGSATIT